jgi:hypothetical protein
MGFLKSVFGGGKKKREEEIIQAAAAAAECGHATLVPRWDSAEDMGKADKITVYHCEGCSKDFTPAEAEAMRA